MKQIFTSKGLVARLLPLAILASFASVASAVDKESVTFTEWQPVQTGVAADGSLKEHLFTVGSYTLGKIKFDGNLEEINGTTFDYGSENRVEVTSSHGVKKDVQLSAVNDYTGVLHVSGEFYCNYGTTTPNGNWQFRFRDTYDDTPGGGVPDSVLHTITFTFTDETIQAPAAEDLGTIGGPGLSIVRSIGAAEVKWFKFTITGGTGAQYFDIDTEDSIGFGDLHDTEIGLFAADGSLIADDDDSATDYQSLLSFGTSAGTRPALGNGYEYTGQDGDLAPGTYYLAVGAFNTNFADQWTVSSTSNYTGDAAINLRTDIGGGGGGGTTTVNANSFSITAGDYFSGFLTNVNNSDNNRLCLFNDTTTLVGEIVFTGSYSGVVANVTMVDFELEAQAARPALSQSLDMYNYTLSDYVNVSGIEATTVDSTVVGTLNGNVAVNFNGDTQTRVTWAPINDEDPSQDGWVLCVDVAKWIVHHS